MMVGRLLSFWEGNFSGAMLVLGMEYNFPRNVICWDARPPSQDARCQWQI